jgi:FAD/FMN-containing dehydrogenase
MTDLAPARALGQRRAMLNPADNAFAESLAADLPEGTIRATDPRHREEPRGRWRAPEGPLAQPRSVEQVAAIVRACAAARVGIIPYGGGTGLVGGQIATDGPAPLILSLERMTAIRATHRTKTCMVAEAGATLAAVQQAAADANRLFPLSLASEGTATIGGNLATNAGGTGVLRYGNARDLCLGLEAVMADGTIWHGLSRLRKDNTGYDLRHLLIGSEGTLGIITAASLRLFPIPAETGAALLAVESPAAALRLLALAQDRLGQGVSAFELMHRMGMDFLSETMPEFRQPWPDPPDWSVLIDLGLPHGADPAPRWRICSPPRTRPASSMTA